MRDSRISINNISVFTSLRRFLHGAERECFELVNCSFLNEREKNVAEDVYLQIMFCLNLTKDL